MKSFDVDDIFTDAESIIFGQDFRPSTITTVQRADLFLVLIGPRFDLDRLARPDDILRLEIAAAFAAGIRVIPVLFENARLPPSGQLPAELQRLTSLNAATIRPDPDFDADMAYLVGEVRQLLPRRRVQVERVVGVAAREASAAVAAFEGSIGSLNNLVQDGAFQVWDEDYVRKAIQMVLIWREQEGADPQVFELLVTGIVKRIHDRLTDPVPLRRELLRLGADDFLAEDISQSITATVGSMADLGDDDPRQDAELLEKIAEATDRTAAAVEGMDLPKEKALVRKVGEGAVIAAGGTIGKAAGDKGLQLLRELVNDEWPKLQIGLMLGWRAVRELFVR